MLSSYHDPACPPLYCAVRLTRIYIVFTELDSKFHQGGDMESHLFHTFTEFMKGTSILFRGVFGFRRELGIGPRKAEK